MTKRKTCGFAAMASAMFALAAVGAAKSDNDGWIPHFYKGLEAVGTVEWLEKGYKDRSPAVRLKWESGAMKFGIRKIVGTELTGCVDWTVTADVLSEGKSGFSGASMVYFDENGKTLGTVRAKRTVDATGWRRVTWTFSTPAIAKRFEVHLFSLRTDPVRFANMKVTSKQGIDKGEIPFNVMAVPAEWNKDWNGGEVRMQNFTDAPIPVLFYLKGLRKELENPVLEVEIPAELGITDACCPNGTYYEKLSPVETAFVTNGQRYVRYSFGDNKYMKSKNFAPDRYKFDEVMATLLVIAPRAGVEADGKSYTIRYRTKDVTKSGVKRGDEKSMKMNFRRMPSDLRTSDDFYVYSWNNGDRHFSTDAAANAAARAYEAAGIRSYRRALQNPSRFTRKHDLVSLYEKRPVKYIFSARFGELWFLSVSRIGPKLEKELGVRRAVSSNLRDPSQAVGKMCPEYFINDRKFREHLRTVVRRELAISEVKDGDWVTFDMEPWHSATWCRCDECHKAFAKFIGWDRVPTAKEIDGPLAEKWADFRCMHNEKSVEIVSKMIREYNPSLLCVDYDYIIPYGDKEGMKARRMACAKDSLANEKWLDGHLCSYYHKIDRDSFDAMKNNTRHLKKFYVPLAALGGCGGYLRPGEVLNPKQIKQFALASFVNGCPGYAFYSGVCFDGEILVAMMEAQDMIVDYEGLPWRKKDGTIKPECPHPNFAYASTVRPDGTEVLALFNYDAIETITVSLQGREIAIGPYETVFTDAKPGDTGKQWRRPRTTRRYLQPPLARNMFTMWNDGKIIRGDVTHSHDWSDSYYDLESDVLWLMHGEKDEPFDFKTAVNRLPEDGTPFHGLSWKKGGLTVSMDAFCETGVALPSCFIRVTVENDGTAKTGIPLAVMLRRMREYCAVKGAPDIYRPYETQTEHFRRAESGEFRPAGFPLAWKSVSAVVRSASNKAAKWDWNDSALRFTAFPEPGKPFVLTLTMGVQDAVARPEDWDAAKAAAAEFWRGELARINRLPPAVRDDPEKMRLVKNLTVQMLQCISRPLGSDIVLPRQGGLQRYVWPWDCKDMLTALALIGDFSPYIEGVLDFYFREYSAQDGRIGPFKNDWVCNSGECLYSLSRYCRMFDKRAVWERHRTAAFRVFDWIRKKRRETVDDPEKGMPGLFPTGWATDNPNPIQLWSFTDHNTLVALKAFALAAKHFKDPRAAEVQAEADDLQSLIASIYRRFSDAAKNKDEFRIPLTPDGNDQTFRKSGQADTAQGYVLRVGLECGHVPESDVLKVYKWHLNKGIASTNGLCSLLPPKRCRSYRHIWYTTSSEQHWYWCFRRIGRDDLADKVWDAMMKYSMSDEYCVGERYDDTTPWYFPWSPNASGSGRLIRMLLNDGMF